MLGRNLIPALKARKTAEAGVQQWMDSNPPIAELMEERKWLEATMVVISRGIVKAATWGVMWRVGVGASFSFADLVTDIFVAHAYYVSEKDRFGYFLATVICIGTTIILQLLLVFAQNKKIGKGRILREVRLENMYYTTLLTGALIITPNSN